ncbi:hypothetical protein [Actinoplanes flavus]|uniref:DUF551 domain-containing protein n=1 Tax=Actinoplanes flavus TaxID=2820290 RepID=A0ABS3UNS3_9ACTN|nr:hypothetical protein [Actinoplanes flavus]MBO3740414.1 hypothetical protein [Actinoplanes flavus]
MDEHLRKGQIIQAVKVYRDSFPPETRPGLNDALEIVLQRRDELAAPGEIEPEPPAPTIDDLAARAVMAGPVHAVELVWDGDTFGWIEDIVAVVERPGPENPRYTGHRLHACRGGDGDDIGRQLAERLAVPYWNPAPDAPDLDAPRWWSRH